jgi:hypothetical protein
MRQLVMLIFSTLIVVESAGWPANMTPPFPPSWKMTDSTVLLYWRNGTGYEDSTLHSYSLLIFDWAHAAKIWINDYVPMDNGAVLSEQCYRSKRVNPQAKCLVYRNTVKALNQFADISSLIDDPAYSRYFLHWKAGAAQTGKCNIFTNGGPPLMPNPQVEWVFLCVCVCVCGYVLCLYL